MFSLDLSWTEANVEKVGERRERIARERSTPSATPSVKSTISSRASLKSVAKDKVLFWTSNLKKAKSLKPIKAVRSDRPSTSRSTTTSYSRKTSNSSPRQIEVDVSHDLRDPSLQPAWTYTGSLSPNLPSGQLIDPHPPVYGVPELEGDASSRGVKSNGSRSPDEQQCNAKSSGRVKDDTIDTQRFNPGSFAPCIIRKSPDGGEPAAVDTYKTPDGKSRRRAYSVRMEGCQDLERLSVQDPAEIATPVLPVDRHAPSNATWKPPTGWNIGLSTVEQQLEEQESQISSTRVLDGIAIAQNTLLELTRFQRFIRRMETAGPKVILDRLKEEWDDTVDVEADEELRLEKQLWVLTAFQLQSLEQLDALPKPACNTGKILELFGHLAEAYHLSAMHPRQKVQYLTTEPRRPMPLPGNVSYSTVQQPCAMPIPWPDATFSHIRASSLPSLVPSSEMPKLLRECHRLLAPGGMLELRIMDAAPVRRTAGPKMRAWIEDRVSLNLERKFRCSKPCMLVPAWVSDAGFELAAVSITRLPCASFQQSTDIDEELKARVGQSMWKNIWGDFVDDDAGEAAWWWEDEGVMQECLERGTMLECGVIYAHKK